MKNLYFVTFSIFLLTCASAGSMGQDSPPVSSNWKAIKCNATYCAKAELHHATNSPGKMTVYKKLNGQYVPAGISCRTIGGKPLGRGVGIAAWTPNGVFSVFKKTRPLVRHNGTPENGYDYASHFVQTPSNTASNVAIHTTPTQHEYSENSHACLRTSCAPQIYSLQGDVEVQIDYVD